LAAASEWRRGANFRRGAISQGNPPILLKYCSDCHAEGMKKGGVSFDEFASDDTMLAERELWWNALRYLRAA